MNTSGRGERGQALVEFAILFLVFMMLTTGLVDAGRAFYQYNALSSAARFGARWASIVGGACNIPGTNVNDWCTQQGTATGGFWTQAGNVPLQGNNVACPAYPGNEPNVPATTHYYNASDPDNDGDNDYTSAGNTDGDTVSNDTTIVGIIDQHFDTSNASSGLVDGAIGGFDLTKLRVCIQSTAAPSSVPARGDYTTVVLSYRFNPVSILLARSSFYLNATSQYEIQG